MAASSYIFRVTASIGGVDTIVSLPVAIGRSSIVAGLQGVGSIESSLADIYLDGSSSYDPDSKSSVLDYVWFCSDANGNDCAKSNGDDLLLGNASTARIPANSLSSSLVGIAYTFALPVHRPSVADHCKLP
jgi:hypothetical protein